MTTEQLSLAQARQVAIRAAGVGAALGSAVEALDHLAVVQLDSIKAVARAHQLTLATRTARMSTVEVDEELWGDGRAPVAFEFWAHAASLVPLADWPLWEFRRRRTRTTELDWRPEPAVRARVLAAVADLGPVTMSRLRGGERASSGWSWGPVKTAVEYLVWTGELACVRREGWNRLFDLPERVLPPRLLDADPEEREAVAQLIDKAARVLGVATVEDLADYLRVSKDQVADVVIETPLRPVRVEGWRQPAWAHPEALAALEHPAHVGTLLVGPFDNLIWYRPRLRRLFGVDHVLEAYKPAAKRRYGYFAMPLLHGARFVGRADMAVTDSILQPLSLALEEGHDITDADLRTAVDTLARTVGARASNTVPPI